MAGLPLPDVQAGPRRDLAAELHALHHRAGWPSLRAMARKVGCSHTAVSAVFSSPRVPPWGTLQVLVEALGGDVDRFHQLWLAASAPESPGVAVEDRSLAGRRDELKVLRHHLTEPRRGLLVIAGEAGIGKSRLVRAGAEAAADEVFVGFGSCLPLSLKPPLLPIADVLRVVQSDGDPEWFTASLAACPPFVGPVLHDLAPHVETGEPPAAAGLIQVSAAVRALLSALAERRPMAVVVEDLHWADATTLDLLEHLVAGSAAGPPPVPLVGTYRIDDPTTPVEAARWFTRIRRLPTVEVMELPPLSREDTAAQIGTMLGSTPTRDLVTSIYERSQGLPLFTEQLAAHTQRAANLPRLLSDLLDQRLEPVSSRGWVVAASLAVAGRALPEALLGQAVGLEQAGLAEALHELRNLHLLEYYRHDGSVALRHPLVAEAAQARLTAAERAELHRHLARALAGSALPDPAEVAHHWRGAGDAVQELCWTIRAAQTSEARAAREDAATLWQRVLELWPGSAPAAGDPPMRRVEAHLATGRTLLEAYRFAEAQEVIERALAEVPGFTVAERADALFWLAARSNIASGEERRRSTALRREAIALYGTTEPCPMFATAIGYEGVDLIYTPDYPAAAAKADEAWRIVAQARDHATGTLPDPRSAVKAVAVIAWLHAAAGHVDTALQHLRYAIDDLAIASDPSWAAEIAVVHADALLMGNRPATDIEQAVGQALATADALGIDFPEVAQLRLNLVEAWLRAGNVTQAAATLAAAGTSSVDVQTWKVGVARAQLDVVEGRLDEAGRTLDHLIDAGYLEWSLDAAHLRTLVDLWAGHPEAALDRMLEALAATESLVEPGLLGAMLNALARSAADTALRTPRSGREAQSLAEEVERVIEAWRPWLANRLPVDQAARPQFVAELARITGSDTVEDWARAAETWDRAKRPHDAGYCRWRAADRALTGRQGTLAARLLRRATRDARGHAPLTGAIALTAQMHPVKVRAADGA